MKRTFWAIAGLSAVLVALALILSGLNFGVHWAEHITRLNKIAGWLVVLSVSALSLVVVCSWWYATYCFRREGIPSLFAILLAVLAFGCILAIPAYVSGEYLDAIGTTPLPLPFYIITVITFTAMYGFTAYIFDSNNKDLGSLRRAVSLVLLFSLVLVASTLSIAYGYSSILYMQDRRIEVWARILVSIANAAYFVALLAAPPMGIAAELRMEREEREARSSRS